MDIGDAGRHSDGGVLANSSFGQALQENKFCIPPASVISGMFLYINYSNLRSSNLYLW